MSRIGRLPVNVPNEVKVNIELSKVVVSGPKGSLEVAIPLGIEVAKEENHLQVKRKTDNKKAKAAHGLVRALLNSAVIGVTKGFEKSLEMSGVGYRVSKQGAKLVFQLGFSHPIEIDPPKGIEFIVEGQTKIKVVGSDKQMVGQMAANIKELRPVEPYKAKGIFYPGQYIRRKAGKAAKTAGAK